MNRRATTIRPWASNLISPDCHVPACDGFVEWAVSFEGHDGAHYRTRYACNAHVGDVAANFARALNPRQDAA